MTDDIIPGDARLPGGPDDSPDAPDSTDAQAAMDAPAAERSAGRTEPDPDGLADYEAIQDDDDRTGENYYEEMIDTTGPFIEGGDDVDTGAGRSRPRD